MNEIIIFLFSLSFAVGYFIGNDYGIKKGMTMIIEDLLMDDKKYEKDTNDGEE